MRINANKLQNSILILLFFFITIWPQVTTLLIILLTIVRIPRLNKEYFISLLSRKSILLFILIYFLLVVGVFYTIDLKSGFSKLQTQFSFFIIPFILGGLSIQKKDRIKYLNFFVFGLIITIFTCLFHALYLFLKNDSIYVLDKFSRKENIFFYNTFSGFMDLHPTYLAMYIGLSIMYIIICFRDISILNSSSKVLLIIFLSITMLLTSSKGAILALIVILLSWLSFNLFKKKMRIKKVLLVVVSIFIFIALFYNTKLYQRYITSFQSINSLLVDNQNINESTSIRFNLWKLSYNVFLNSPSIGYGTGSVKKVLNDNCLTYFDFSTCEFLRNMNSHNEYINSLVSNGIIFLIVFLVVLSFNIVKSYKNSDILYLSFMVFMVINFLFESILQRERGIVFFMLMLVLFSISNYDRKELL
ncbi:O-antigen ligase family protein [Joostella sp.]|uniref:O-antigen ligase family protein n=1 Tax=Joostella sp. TaxID=2231138 RepID=UPI003A942178